MRNWSSIFSNGTRVNWWLDLSLLLFMLLALAPQFTGLPIHEWLSLAMIAALVLHLLLHWDWTVAVLRHFCARLAGQARFNLVLNTLVFIDLTIVMFTGIAISRAALPALGLVMGRNEVWSGLHRWSANMSVFLFSLHVAVHWKWIVNAFQRFIVKPLTPRRQPAQAVIAVEVKSISPEGQA